MTEPETQENVGSSPALNQVFHVCKHTVMIKGSRFVFFSAMYDFFLIFRSRNSSSFFADMKRFAKIEGPIKLFNTMRLVEEFFQLFLRLRGFFFVFFKKHLVPNNPKRDILDSQITFCQPKFFKQKMRGPMMNKKIDPLLKKSRRGHRLLSFRDCETKKKH